MYGYILKKYPKDQFVYIVKSHKCTQPHTNSTIKKAAEVAKELNQSNENSDTKMRTVTQK